MTKKIIFICGSPRKNGNTNQLVQTAAQAAELAGADVTVVDATEVQFSEPGCIACLACQSLEDYSCVLDDELSAFVDTLPQYDAIIMASPLYWWSFTAQLKIVIDRMFCLAKYDEQNNRMISPLSGKIAGLIATSGGKIEENLELLDNQWKTAAEFLGLEYRSLLVPLAPMDPDEFAANNEAFDQASDFGLSLAGGV